MKSKTIAISVPVLMMACATGGCGEADPGEHVAEQGMNLSTREAADAPLASLTTSAGSKVTFLGGDEDGVSVVVVGVVGRADPELEAARRAAAGDAARLYDALAKSPAPLALRDAVLRDSQARFTVDASDEGEAEVASPSAAGTLASATPTAASSGFCNIYNYAYNGSGAFEYCWPNQYGEPWVKRKGDHMACRFDVVDGPTRVRARYKNAGGWHTVIDIVLSDNQFMQFEQSYRYAKRWRECKTVGNPYHRKLHFRVVGHDNLAAVPYNPVAVDFP